MQNELKTAGKPEQILLFGNAEIDGIPIDTTAMQLGVSSATIRNWLKTGYLRPAGKGKIDQESLRSFERQYAGRKKLTSRANKSQKDTLDHSLVSTRFIHIETEAVRTDQPRQVEISYKVYAFNANGDGQSSDTEMVVL